MTATASIVISIISVCIAGATAWWTVFRRGRLAMTPPSIIFFGFDEVPHSTAKVFVRALLFSTAAHGQVVEAMYAKLCRAGSEQVFGFWGYGETNRLTAGSGLYVGQTGVALNHHFVLSVHQPTYEFVAGPYEVEVFARIVGRKTPAHLTTARLTVSDENAASLRRKEGVLFELGPDTGVYLGHARPRPTDVSLDDGPSASSVAGRS